MMNNKYILFFIVTIIVGVIQILSALVLESMANRVVVSLTWGVYIGFLWKFYVKK